MNAQPVVDKKPLPVWLIIIIVSIVSLIAGCALCVGGSFAMQDLGLLSTSTPTSIPTVAFTLAPSFTSTLTSTSAPLPTSTATDTPIPPQLQTAQALSDQATTMASYQAIDPRELSSYSNQHIGDNVKVKITIFNIVDNQDLQGLIYGTYDAVYITTSVPFSRIYKGDVITVYGTVSGTVSGINSYGVTITQPSIINAFYTK